MYTLICKYYMKNFWFIDKAIMLLYSEMANYGEVVFTANKSNPFRRKNNEKVSCYSPRSCYGICFRSLRRKERRLQYDGRTWISFSYEGYELRNVKNHSTFALFHNGDTYSPNYPDCPAISDVLNLDPCRPLRESNLVFSSQLPFSQRLSSVAMNLIVQYATNAEVFHPEISLSQYIRNSDFNMLYWRVNYGFFSGGNPERLSFHEWKHFQASQRFFPMRSEETGVVGFVALDPYALSTNDWHVDASFRMFREKLLLLHIPNLRPLFIKGEAISLTAAYTKQQGKVYSEVGYELLNVLDAIHVGVYASFSNAHYQSLHFKMGVTPPKMTFRQAVKNIRLM